MSNTIPVKKITDAAFRKYGRVIDGLDVSELLSEMEHTPQPDDVIYVPSEESLENTDAAVRIRKSLYGGLPVQIGYCNGNNYLLNAVEYHRDSEIDIAVTNLILLLGWQPDIADDYTYDTSKIEAFLVPAGTSVELYATTLHYAPCSVEDSGFKCIVVLPKHTNTDLDSRPENIEEDKLLFAKNKWLIGHEDANISGAFNGLIGDNISIK